ncbi:hypothetical protein TNCV_4133231 [Trichonephila clavipes]|uniref:Uncharacterized protein n=1 Tax=Trichonephila clavipes TaxID=2585209 RepID=A0A8X6S8P4_TRICX|nr:hypothetical protein TNCV_4133231 [Trichonephila clavipes]
MHRGKDQLFTIANSGYRSVELSPLVQHNVFPDGNSRTTVRSPSVMLQERNRIPTSTPNQLGLRITCGTKMNLIRKEGTTPLRYPTTFGTVIFQKRTNG